MVEMTRTEKMARRNQYIDGPVRYGFEPEDQRQEIALGRLIAAKKYGNDHEFAQYRRSRAQVAMHRGREARWNNITVRLKDHDRAEAGKQFEAALFNEVMDLLPFVTKEEVLLLLTENDGRKIRKAARLVREALPNINFGDEE